MPLATPNGSKPSSRVEDIMFKRILCAIDLSDATPSLLRHAAGLANAANASLVIVHVATVDDSTRQHIREEVERQFLSAVPYEAGYATADVRVVRGERATAILMQAAYTGADLIVMGTRGFGNLTGWFMGSTSRLLMEATSVPVLLIPPTPRDIVTLGGDRAHLHFGPVLAAVDLDEHNDAQLLLASQMAALAQQPLVLLTVIPEGGPSAEEVTAAVWTRVHDIGPTRPHMVVIRHGDVAREIGRAALAEGAGLVVMGLRNPRTGDRPGQIATAVLETKRSFVLAVPETAYVARTTEHAEDKGRRSLSVGR